MAANEHQVDEKAKQIDAIARLIAPIAGSLRKLSRNQAEELVLFLKDLHNPPDPCDHEWDGRMKFEAKLEVLKNSPEQLRLQKMAYNARWVSVACGVGAGICVTLAIVIGLTTQRWIVPALLGIPTIVLLMKADKLGVKTILISKEQDQKYLLSSLREARCVSELNLAGLFAHADDAANPQSKHYSEKKAEEVIARLTQQMRDAIYRNACEGNLADYTAKLE